MSKSKVLCFTTEAEAEAAVIALKSVGFLAGWRFNRTLACYIINL
jgi:hypothetical protein